MSLQANEFDSRSILHGQVSLAAVNPIRVVHEAMNGCENLKRTNKGLLRKCKYILHGLDIGNTCTISDNGNSAKCICNDENLYVFKVLAFHPFFTHKKSKTYYNVHLSHGDILCLSARKSHFCTFKTLCLLVYSADNLCQHFGPQVILSVRPDLNPNQLTL